MSLQFIHRIFNPLADFAFNIKMAQKFGICDGCRSCTEEPDELWDLVEKAMNSETCHCKCLFALQNSGTKIQPPALTVACILNHIECVRALIDAGADVHVTTKQKYVYNRKTFRWEPVAEYDGSECTVVVNGIGSIDEIYAVNKTALMWAADMGICECVNKLVSAGADVNKMDNAKCTALTYATKGGQGGCMEILIEAGADVNKGTGLVMMDMGYRSECKKTALMWLLSSDLQGHRSLADGESMCYHMNNSQYNARIQKSSCNGFDALLAAGADVNIIDEKGRTALIYAAMQQDKPQYVKKLLDAGANVNMADFGEISPLMSALLYQAVKNVDLLLKAGAVVNAENSSALFDCCYGNWKNVKLLLRAGLRINTSKKGIFIYHKLADEFYAAGERIPPEIISYYIRRENRQYCLKHQCRVRIRKHLLELDPHENLFVRVPQLGLPKSLATYLLYDVSMDDVNDKNRVDKKNAFQ